MHTFEVTLDAGEVKAVEADYYHWGDDFLAFFVAEDDDEVATFRTSVVESVMRVEKPGIDLSVVGDFGELKDAVSRIVNQLKRAGRI